MYELLYNEEDKTCEIDLPYKLKNYSNPYRVNRDDLTELLDKRKQIQDLNICIYE